jgi:dihydroorotate dehydrogenase
MLPFAALCGETVRIAIRRPCKKTGRIAVSSDRGWQVGAEPVTSVVDLAYQRVLRPVLFRAYDGDAERIHERTLAMITKAGEVRPARAAAAVLCARHRTPVNIAGIRFPGLVGLAAGMDKNGAAIRSWAALGFGHAELGTVTAHEQPGSDRPRLFRLPDSQALINRMGFNNAGAKALADRLSAAGVVRGNQAVGIPLGISIGKSKITPLAEVAEDYLTSLRLLAPYADYLAINVSSPNTPGLRTLQDGTTLRQLISVLVGEAWRIGAGRPPVPIFVKLAPDLTEDALEEALAACTEEGVEGLIATNTTLARDGLHPADQAAAAEAGGLSGAPLATRARQVVAFLTARTSLPVIGVGGILTRDDGQAMLDAGARLLQVYTGYIYRGPALVSELNRLQPPAGVS